MDFEAAGTSEATSTLECFRQRILSTDSLSLSESQTLELVWVQCHGPRSSTTPTWSRRLVGICLAFINTSDKSPP